MAKIIRMTTVVRDGMHNAFTDLQFWQGCYWVGYRKGSGHRSMDSEAVISVSTDRERFREVAKLRVRGDNRDPKLLPLDEDRMAAYWPSWTEGVEPRRLQQYISFSRNGYDWGEPEPVLDAQMWLWRIRPHDGRYFGLVQSLAGDWAAGSPHELDLIVSDNLCEWETITRIGDGLGLNESDIHFRDDGEAWLVSRTVRRDDEVGSYFASAPPPYTEWTVTPMRPVVNAPVFVEHESDLYVAGRCRPTRDGETTFPFPGGASTAVWRVRRGELEPGLRMPATGDCSYPGLVKDPEGRVCMSYYSQHAYHTGVVDCPRENAADVFFAELDLD